MLQLCAVTLSWARVFVPLLIAASVYHPQESAIVYRLSSCQLVSSCQLISLV